MDRGDQINEIFLCLRALIRPELPLERSYSNFSWSNWMTNVSVLIQGSHHRITSLSSCCWRRPSPAESPSYFSLKLVVGKLYKSWRELQVIKRKLQELSSRVSGKVCQWRFGRRVTTLPCWQSEWLSLRIFPKDFFPTWFRKSFEKERSCNPLIPDVRITVSVLDMPYKMDLTFLVVRLSRFQFQILFSNILDFSEFSENFSGLFWKISVVGVDRYR